MTCVSIYSADFDSDYGDGPGAALWIDNLGENCFFIVEYPSSSFRRYK